MHRHTRRLFGCAIAILILVAAPRPGGAQTEDFATYSTSSALTEDHADMFRLYWAFFDREPDGTGARYWVGEFDRCASLLDITWSFGSSTEFVNRYGQLSNGQYIDLVYANVLGRAPDPGGRAYWLGLLDSGELIQAEVMLYFSLGSEFTARHPLPSDGRPSGGCTPPSAVTVSYANCDAVRAAGAAPLYRGEPGYRAGLDRDGDGIACEV